MGAEDRFLVRVYRDVHVKHAAALIATSLWSDDHHTDYHHVGEVKGSSKALDWELSGWCLEAFSTTKLAALIPLMVLLGWLVVL